METGVRIYLILLTLLLAGCATNQLGTKMASWQGSHIDHVIASWGPADQCADQHGQQICTWSDGGLYIESGTSLQFGNVGRPRCARMLAVDADGVVTGWKWRGDGCDLRGRSVLAKNERVEQDRPSAVSGEFELADDSSARTARQ